jgi:hypothetical protein
VSNATVGTRRPTTARILGTLGVLGAVGAVAGLSTFGDFTGATTPVDTTVDTGVLSIDVTKPVAVSLDSASMLPGDSSAMPLDLVNDGDVELSSVTFTSAATASSALDADTVHGLQLAVESCSQAWAAAGDAYTCAGDTSVQYAGPVVADRELRDAASLAAAGVDHLLVTLSLPTTAGESMKNQVSELAMTFTAVQREGETR